MGKYPRKPPQRRSAPPEKRGTWGTDLEQELNRTHHFYQIKGIACIRKNGQEWRFTTDRDRQGLARHKAGLTAVTDHGRAMTAKSSAVDYIGNAGSKFVAFDAKDSTRPSIPIKERFTAHQRKALMEHERCGGIAGFMVRFSKLNRVFFLRASVVEEAHTEMLFHKGPKSISVKFCELRGVEIPITDILIDWASVLIKDDGGQNK